MDESLLKRVQVTEPLEAVKFDGKNSPKPDRYKWLSLNLTEPNLGVPKLEAISDEALYKLTNITNVYSLSVCLFPDYINNITNLIDPIQVYPELKIDIILDTSSPNSNPFPGTLNTFYTLTADDSPLWNFLEPFYGYNRFLAKENVRLYRDTELYTGPGERTLNWAATSLLPENGLNSSSKKICITICDESHNAYYQVQPFNEFLPQSQQVGTHYRTDYAALTTSFFRASLSGYAAHSVHLGVGKPPRSNSNGDGYFKFLTHIKNGLSAYKDIDFKNNNNFIINDIFRGANAEYYSYKIIESINLCGYSSSIRTTNTYYVTSNLIGERGFTGQPSNTDIAAFKSQERPDLATVDAALEELLYIEPKFVTLTLNNSSSQYISPPNYDFYVEPGTELHPGMLRWTVNKKSNAAIDKYQVKVFNDFIDLDKESLYKFKFIKFKNEGFGYTVAPPQIITVTPNPSSIISSAVLKAEMHATIAGRVSAIAVVEPGLYTTYNIGISVLPGSNPSPVKPVISFVDLLELPETPPNFYDIGTIRSTSDTTQAVVSTIEVRAIDWSGRIDTAKIRIFTTSPIYYGVSTVQNISSNEIISGVNVTGGLKRLTNFTARSYNIDCSQGGAGGFYYIAYPSYIGSPSTVVNGFPVTNIPVSNISMPSNRPGVGNINYNALISNNRQRSTIPINVS